MLEPKINNHLKVVVGGLIYQNKKILICQRKEEGDHPLKWEFPGGKVKDLEDNQEALIRELKEELNNLDVNSSSCEKSVRSFCNLTIFPEGSSEMMSACKARALDEGGMMKTLLAQS